MENYAYSYPDSGDSSPRSREIDFENPPPSWEEQPPLTTHTKVKFMVSYGGKIQPRPHDNQLSYIGGETKILSIDRSVKFSSIISKLSSLFFSGSVAGAGAGDSNSGVGAGVILGSFKYQLPGEDLDALISVTNDDDLEHMMHEYDRLLLRSSSKPPAPRLRLFLFPAQSSGLPEPGNLDRDRDRFVEALNSGLPPEPSPVIVNNGGSNMDFLFGLDNKPPVQVVKPISEPDPQIDARIQELNRIQISAVQEEEQQQQQQQAMFRQKSDENLVVAFGGELYQKSPPTIPMSVQIPAGYWQSPGIEQPQQPPQQQPQPPPHQPQQVYMIHARPPTGMYHAQMMGPPPVTGQPGQGYYQVQRVSADPVYREQQPVYSMAPAPSPAPAPVNMAGVMPESTGYAQVAYDSVTGRQVYYAAPGIATAPFRGGVAANDMRPAGGGLTDAEGKVVTKVLPTSAAV